MFMGPCQGVELLDHKTCMQSVSTLVTEQFSTVVMTIKLPQLIYQIAFSLMYKHVKDNIIDHFSHFGGYGVLFLLLKFSFCFLLTNEAECFPKYLVAFLIYVICTLSFARFLLYFHLLIGSRDCL